MGKFLILGSSGLLGSNLVKILGLQATGLSHKDIDIVDYNSVEGVLRELKPAIVINCAAFCNVEECEKNPEHALSVNAVGAYNVSRACATIGATVVYISSEYVFNGAKDGFCENDFPAPLNVYGISKLAGENLVRANDPRHYIIRTSFLFSQQPSRKGFDFFHFIVNSAKAGNELRVVQDQFSSPTYVLDLAFKIKELIESKAPFGVYHITNSGQCSRYDFAKNILDSLKLSGRITPISSKDFSSKVYRPRNSVLLNSELKKIKLQPLRHWKDALRECVLKIGG